MVGLWVDIVVLCRVESLCVELVVKECVCMVSRWLWC